MFPPEPFGRWTADIAPTARLSASGYVAGNNTGGLSAAELRPPRGPLLNPNLDQIELML